MTGVKPGTWQEPTITVTADDVRVLVRGVTIAKLVQLPKGKRWAIAVRGRVVQPDQTWRYREEAIDGLKAMYANGVPGEHQHHEAVPE
jgi:hypothetical protein